MFDHLTKSTQPIGLLRHGSFIRAIFGAFSLLFHSPFSWLSAEQQIANNYDLAHKIASCFPFFMAKNTDLFNSTELLLACFFFNDADLQRETTDWRACCCNILSYLDLSRDAAFGQPLCFEETHKRLHKRVKASLADMFALSHTLVRSSLRAHAEACARLPKLKVWFVSVSQWASESFMTLSVLC